MTTIPVQRLGAIAADEYLEHLLALSPNSACRCCPSSANAVWLRRSLRVPPSDPRSLQNEAFAERLALYDFALKAHVETMRRVGLAMVGADRR